MNWHVTLKLPYRQDTIMWLKEIINEYDGSKIKDIRIANGKDSLQSVSGFCYYPSPTCCKYRLTCFVPSTIIYPNDIQVRSKNKIYETCSGEWENPGEKYRIISKGKSYKDGVLTKLAYIYTYTTVNNIDEGIVWIFGHELSHYLRHTKQILGRNTEISADRFADELLKRYRESRKSV